MALAAQNLHKAVECKTCALGHADQMIPGHLGLFSHVFSKDDFVAWGVNTICSLHDFVSCDMCRLTWQELGITKVEWTAHRMQKALNARRLDVQAKLNALAPLGASPRTLTEIGPGELCNMDVMSCACDCRASCNSGMRKAETSHIKRIRERLNRSLRML